MPAFQTSEAYTKKADGLTPPPKPPRKARTAPQEVPSNVTLSYLMKMKPDDSFITVRVPTTTPDGILYDTISFNYNVDFLAGETYTLHPIVAQELYHAIRNHAVAITNQKRGLTIESKNLLYELKRQEEAERVMFSQFAEAGIVV